MSRRSRNALPKPHFLQFCLVQSFKVFPKEYYNPYTYASIVQKIFVVFVMIQSFHYVFICEEETLWPIAGINVCAFLMCIFVCTFFAFFCLLSVQAQLVAMANQHVCYRHVDTRLDRPNHSDLAGYENFTENIKVTTCSLQIKVYFAREKWASCPTIMTLFLCLHFFPHFFFTQGHCQ